MKTLFTALAALTLTCSFAFAETGSSLKKNMKQAGTLFKSIGGTVKDPTKNLENAKSAEQMAEIFNLVLAQIPEAVQEMPEAQRAAAIADYQAMIQQEIQFCTELQAAFLANNNDLAAQIYQKMKDLKSEGHDRFDP